MATVLDRESDSLYRDVLGADAKSVERAVIDRQLAGEEDINKVVLRLAELFRASKGDIYAVLGVTSSRVSRRSKMDVDVLDRAGTALNLYARVAAMIGGDDAAAWFRKPNEHLEGRRPIDLLGTGLGRQSLASMILSLEDGAYL